MALELACAHSPSADPPAAMPQATMAASAVPDKELEELQRYIDEQLFGDLAKFVAVQTYRTPNQSEEQEAQVVANLQQLQDELSNQTQRFNEGQKVHKLATFEWKKKIGAREHWLFGIRVGTGPRRIALSSHLDTVPPGTQAGWEPFKLVAEQRSYPDKKQDFYVGRGAIDDKGPALVAFHVLQAVARHYDGDPKLDRVTLEILFDTAEETDMAMPYYLKDRPDEVPELGIIFDAFWCVRAEKGLERPVFTIQRRAQERASKRGASEEARVWIEKLYTPNGPTNQIPDEATAILSSDSVEALQRFAQQVGGLYRDYEFDDRDYRRARMTVDVSELASKKHLILKTTVEGAQHGSAPDENRKDGSNPLVSLTNFLSRMVGQHLERNEISELCRFISWAWGTRVFGEHHPELLKRHDRVFTNGTTYAITRFQTDPEKFPEAAASLELDIRYALDHHGIAWDNKTEGFVGGEIEPGNPNESHFKEIFAELLRQFPSEPGYTLGYTTQTVAPPDVRLPDGETFQRVSRAFSQSMGKQCPALAIGGGTDAKGTPALIAAGALFTEDLGPPINFHGFNEGAPVEDLRRSAGILYQLFKGEVENATRAPPAVRSSVLPIHVAPDAH
ncbi:MAG: M20/M25/M40 family metallo-hydrolase [Hyalangium sp.]|uniref:M20/M25/M40 family metallo-hydrolase n=1 Tax=Hyalangium sp. TaxID=2028555 RepID=UPI00389B0DB9